MKAVSGLASVNNRPRLIPSYKQTERCLLSIFMSALEIVPEFRSEFFKKCGYPSGRTCIYSSYMEAKYAAPNLPEVRPDGLVVCQRGKTTWSSFTEAKADNANIRPEQIQDYTSLAHTLDVDAVISISNEFASTPADLPYHLGARQRKNRSVFHFSWAEIRTFTELFWDETEKCTPAELAVLEQCLEYFWEKGSGITTYDAMPVDWPKFVESSGTELGFNTKTAGITEIVHGWQQEKRDLCAKLIYETRKSIVMRHDAGAYSNSEDRIVYDRKELANNYRLATTYLFKDSNVRLRILADLKSRKLSIAAEFSPPKNKMAKATTTWLAKVIEPLVFADAKVSFDWKGHTPDSTISLSDFKQHPERVCEGKKEAPKNIRIIREIHDVRRFKSRKGFIENLENCALELANACNEVGLL